MTPEQEAALRDHAERVADGVRKTCCDACAGVGDLLAALDAARAENARLRTASQRLLDAAKAVTSWEFVNSSIHPTTDALITAIDDYCAALKGT